MTIKKLNNISLLTSTEKLALKDKINHSVYAYKRRQRKKKFGVVFGLAITLIVTGVFMYKYNNNPLNNYIKASQVSYNKNYKQVKLILNDHTKINIAEENATINYASSKNQIQIGSKDTIQLAQSNNIIKYNTVITPFGKQTRVTLSDGTLVWLNSGSKLVFPVAFIGNKRQVYLEGEAIFDVAHNKLKPFTVMAKNHEIEVLGTVFNVSNYADDKAISTTLKSGSVKINYTGDSFLGRTKSINIKPGTCATYYKNNKHITSKKVNIGNCFSWKDGLFIFKNDNLQTIMSKLSRYYNTPISIENNSLKQSTFSGQLDITTDLEKVLSLIQETSDFKFKKTTDKISIN